MRTRIVDAGLYAGLCAVAVSEWVDTAAVGETFPCTRLLCHLHASAHGRHCWTWTYTADAREFTHSPTWTPTCRPHVRACFAAHNTVLQLINHSIHSAFLHTIHSWFPSVSRAWQQLGGALWCSHLPHIAAKSPCSSPASFGPNGAASKDKPKWGTAIFTRSLLG